MRDEVEMLERAAYVYCDNLEYIYIRDDDNAAVAVTSESANKQPIHLTFALLPAVGFSRVASRR